MNTQHTNKSQFFLKCFLILVLMAHIVVRAQEDTAFLMRNAQIDNNIKKQILHDYQSVAPFFAEAYRTYPTIPAGVLEAVSYNYTHFFSNLSADTNETDAAAIPRTYSVMGLTLNGKGAFRENLRLVSQLSGVSIDSIILNSRSSILAYASAFAQLQHRYHCFGDSLELYKPVFIALSELPLHKNSVDEFALNSSLYVIYLFLQDSSMIIYEAPLRHLNMSQLFGAQLSQLRQHSVSLTASSESKNEMNVDYPNAIWNPAGSCNYMTGRNGVAVTNVTIHYTQGTYAGAISWFQNCTVNGNSGSQVSAHYVIRSVDGQVTQMVREADKAWHVGIANGYTIGIEHEAYGNVADFFTTAMYQSSAALVRNICSRHPNINPRSVFFRDTLDDGTVLNSGLHNLGGASACTQIRGHQHFPSQSHLDPGPYWNWNYYYKLINSNPVVNTVTTMTGTFTDSGDTLGNYGNDERQLLLIHVPNADSIALTFSSFELEPNFDFMWIYDGGSVFSPKIGRWNTHSPGRVVSSGDAMMVEFRSDCGTTAAGWLAHWQAYMSTISSDTNRVDVTPPTTSIDIDGNQWITGDFTAHFIDTDDVALQTRFYQIMEKNGSAWSANVQNGFLCDNFDYVLNPTIWLSNTGGWQVVNHKLAQVNHSLLNASITARLNDTISDAYLYDFYLTLDTGKESSFFFHCDRPISQFSTLSGYQILLDAVDNVLIINKIVHGQTQLLKRVNLVFYTPHQDFLYRVIWNRCNGKIQVFRHLELLAETMDNPLTVSMTNYIGFATNSAAVAIDNMRVYRSRAETTAITVGSGLTNLIHEQAVNGVSTCKIKSIVTDYANNFSSLAEKSLKVDYSAPTLRYVYDGLENDMDTINSRKNIAANWSPCSDLQSGIKSYYYFLLISTNTTVMSNPVWVNNGINTNFLRSEYYPVNRFTRVGVRVENNAGLLSNIYFSDGVYYDASLARQIMKFLYFPNPVHSELVVCRMTEDSINLNNKVNLQDVLQTQQKLTMDNQKAVQSENSCTSQNYLCRLYNLYGQLMKAVSFTDWGTISLDDLATGMYVAQVWCNGTMVSSSKIIKQ